MHCFLSGQYCDKKRESYESVNITNKCTFSPDRLQRLGVHQNHYNSLSNIHIFILLSINSRTETKIMFLASSARSFKSDNRRGVPNLYLYASTVFLFYVAHKSTFFRRVYINIVTKRFLKVPRIVNVKTRKNPYFL